MYSASSSALNQIVPVSSRKGILELLKSKFPGAGANYARKIRVEHDIERLQAILVAVGRAAKLDEVRAAAISRIEADVGSGRSESDLEPEGPMGCIFVSQSIAREEGREVGREEGMVEGLRKGIVALLRSKLQSEGTKLARKVRLKCEPKGLESLLRVAARAQTIDEVRARLRKRY